MMRGIAPGARRSFAAEDFPFISRGLWKAAREEAKERETDTRFRVYASDIDRAAVELTAHNAEIAGVGDIVNPFVADCRRIREEGVRGTIVTNPPYGERIGGSTEEVERLYREMGVHFRSLAPWQVYIITSHPGFERLYGKRADKVRKLYNGMIPCYLYQFFKNDKR